MMSNTKSCFHPSVLFLLGSLFLLNLCSPARGADNLPDPEDAGNNENERWYQVELVIFRQYKRNTGIEETWPTDIRLLYPDTWVLLKDADEYIEDPMPHPVLKAWLDRIQSSPMTPFVTLDQPPGKSLTGIGKNNAPFPGKVLFHKSWWQPFIRDDEQAPIGILIRAGHQFGEHYELEGSVSFSLGRYLHLHTNLWWTDFSEKAQNPQSSNWFWQTPDGETANPWPALPPLPELAPEETDKPVYVIERIVTFRQSRRMRSEEVHYIDHPELGILVRLIPYKAEEHLNQDQHVDSPEPG
jgi:hypothetical protein